MMLSVGLPTALRRFQVKQLVSGLVPRTRCPRHSRRQSAGPRRDCRHGSTLPHLGAQALQPARGGDARHRVGRRGVARRMNDFPTQAAAFLGVAAESTRGISNVSTRLDSVGSGRTLLPVTVNSCEPDNSWVCSPHTAYYRYAIEELHRFGHPLLTAALWGACVAVSALTCATGASIRLSP